MQNLVKVAILASGGGSNAENICKHALEIGIEIKLIVTDQEDAGIISRALRLNVPLERICYDRDLGKKDHEMRIFESLISHNVDWVLLAGYMRILSPCFLSKFWDKTLLENRVVNIHPAYLPDFPGKNAYRKAFDSGVTESGVTVHFVDSGIDTGTILLQEKIKRFKEDSFEDFQQRGLDLEYRLYPKALRKIFKSGE